jgi:hypothetical protein
MSPNENSRFQAMPSHAVNVTSDSDRSEPSLSEVLLMLMAVFGVYLLIVGRSRDFWKISISWGDNHGYLDIASIIQNWHFAGGAAPVHFWGLPYMIVGISRLFSVPELMALVLVSTLGSLTMCISVHRLYGGWVAIAVFGFINYRWIYMSMEGGAEPLFMCLVYASFLAARRGQWNIASLLASLSTIVRPLGVFALLAFAAILLMRRSYRQLTAITLIGLGMGVLYFVPLWTLLGSPFANFIACRADWAPSGLPLTYPFGSLVFNYLAAYQLRWPVVVWSIAWLVMALLGAVAMWFPRNRQRLSVSNQPEALFAVMYILFIVSYNYAEGVAWDLPRFLMPIYPLLLLSLRNWIPKNRLVLWAAAGLSALMASAAMVGFRNVFGFSLP